LPLSSSTAFSYMGMLCGYEGLYRVTSVHGNCEMLGIVPYWATKNNSQRLMVEHIEGRMDDISKAARFMFKNGAQVNAEQPLSSYNGCAFILRRDFPISGQRAQYLRVLLVQHSICYVDVVQRKGSSVDMQPQATFLCLDTGELIVDLWTNLHGNVRQLRSNKGVDTLKPLWTTHALCCPVIIQGGNPKLIGRLLVDDIISASVLRNGGDSMDVILIAGLLNPNDGRIDRGEADDVCDTSMRSSSGNDSSVW